MKIEERIKGICYKISKDTASYFGRKFPRDVEPNNIVNEATSELLKLFPSEEEIIKICNQIADKFNKGGKIFIEGKNFKDIAHAIHTAFEGRKIKMICPKCKRDVTTMENLIKPYKCKWICKCGEDVTKIKLKQLTKRFQEIF